jgi:mxaC protein
MSLEIEQPLALALLALAALPWLRGGRGAARYSSLEALPPDALSTLLGWALKLAASAAFVALALGLAGINRPGQGIERIGRGAEIVLLLDRSRSMDQEFHVAVRSPADYRPAFSGPQGEPKIKVARRLLAQFAAGRPEDRFAMVVFSAFPLRALDFTQKPEVIQAAIRAGDAGKGLSDTDIGRGLLAALSLFEDRPYTGSRVVLLVSDGGAHLDEDTRRALADTMKRLRVSLYWIYIRSANSPGLLPGKEVSPEVAETVPEHFLHTFFGAMGTPYRAYEAEDPDALQRAISDLSRVESFPIRYYEAAPRQDLSQACYGTALALALLLAAAASVEVRRWR